MAHWTRGAAALALIGVVAAAGMALAQGPDMNLPIFGLGLTPGSFSPSYHQRSFRGGQGFFGSSDPEETRPADYEESRRRDESSRVASFGYGKPICVRLCDGFFFPTASVNGGEAACAAQCPDAPTALYTMPGDDIDEAVSSTGAPYSRLPVAKRYQTSLDNTCSCHRAGFRSRVEEALRDDTLRRGDIVMTAEGFRVYQGGGYGPQASDFVSLSNARLPRAERAELTAMERSSAGPRAPAAPELVAARPRGNVTVDNGNPPPRR